VTGLPDSQAAFLFKQHHCLTDGTGLIQLLALAHADVPAASGTTPQRTPSDLLTRGVAARLAATPRTLVRLAAGSVSGMGQVAARPLEVVGRGVEFAASLKRMLTPPSVRRSPLLLGTGTKPLLVLLDASLADLKAAGKAADGSLNDAFVAAMLGGARRYHDAHGVRRDHVPVAMPVSLRKAGDPHGGNRFAGVRFAGPMSEADPVRRMRKIHELVEAVRDEPAIGFLDYLAPGLTKLPTTAIVELSVSITSSVDLQVSNIRGLEQEATLAGATVTGMYPLGPRPGVAAMIAMITYDGKCCIGINADAEVIDDVEVFEQCFREGLDEVVGVVGRPRSRRARSDR
jgi:WS/DGAT/MGAT family acyltransferase